MAYFFIKIMSFKINIDENENLDVIKFGLPVDIIERYCFGECELFANMFFKMMGGKIFMIDGDHCVVLYKDFYIDVYGIHTLETLKNRRLPTYGSYIKSGLHLYESYNDTGKEITLKEQKSLDLNSCNYYNIVMKEYCEFVINMIINGTVFKEWNESH